MSYTQWLHPGSSTQLPSPRQLSRELRLGDGPELGRRRWIVGLSFFGAAMGQIVSLYQFGIVRKLPDLPVAPFDTNRVDAADYAYKRLNTPDGFLMVLTYAATAALAAAGGRRRAEQSPWLPLLLFGKTVYDVGTTAKLSREEWQETKALCLYCTLGAAASLASMLLAAPEAARAATNLIEDRR